LSNPYGELLSATTEQRTLNITEGKIEEKIGGYTIGAEYVIG